MPKGDLNISVNHDTGEQWVTRTGETREKTTRIAGKEYTVIECSWTMLYYVPPDDDPYDYWPSR